MIESKCHTKISVEEEMRKKMSSLTPRLEKLYGVQEGHTFHERGTKEIKIIFCSHSLGTHFSSTH